VACVACGRVDGSKAKTSVHVRAFAFGEPAPRRPPARRAHWPSYSSFLLRRRAARSVGWRWFWVWLVIGGWGSGPGSGWPILVGGAKQMANAQLCWGGPSTHLHNPYPLPPLLYCVVRSAVAPAPGMVTQYQAGRVHRHRALCLEPVGSEVIPGTPSGRSSIVQTSPAKYNPFPRSALSLNTKLVNNFFYSQK